METFHPANVNPAEVERLLEKYPYEDDTIYKYGTAGFRFVHHVLPPIFVRTAVAVAHLLHSTTIDDGPNTSSCSTNKSVMGIMVTASHNTQEYNGIKITNSSGGMLEAPSEAILVELVNQRSNSVVLETLSNNKSNNKDHFCVVELGRDTRSHSANLACLLQNTLLACGVNVVNHGIVTTPMLHHMVSHAHAQNLPDSIPPRYGRDGYYELHRHTYRALLQTATRTSSCGGKQQPPTLVVDCACGVGHEHLTELVQNYLPHIRPCNAPDSGPLNEGCGSEFVQKQQRPPQLYDCVDKTDGTTIEYGASFDGDADRIVFFQSTPPSRFVLLDGDKISCLIGLFLKEQLEAIYKEAIVPSQLSLGVVQTAYANGSSTAFLKQHKVETAITKTGVKHLHHVAEEQFDIGIYFESNGHGTILFGHKYYEFLHQTSSQVKQSRTEWQRLRLLPALVNQAVGDAISDLLLIDAILQIKEMDLKLWDNLYQDLPSKQLKVTVKDRSVITTNDSETQCLEPPALQRELDAHMQQYGGRTFVRPSGTEDVVRIYAEHSTVDGARLLANKAAESVYTICGGTGAPPTRSNL